ncbi:hypothetical protein BgAZ_104500 [Babesia gibsoni]|uniref:Transmembrane protein n=1 Tax=Babesia gibsoni TaxID=33632 RepID=A0AAD8PFW0_BABGI|nr:hypothetical protein BgAZ_104500 [Babesia gibsoni]
MGQLIRSVVHRVRSLAVPNEGKRAVVYSLGALNFLLFGVGTMIFGIKDDCLEDVIIGAAQLLLPIVGWVWSIAWGAIIIYKKYEESDETRDVDDAVPV